MTEDHPIPGEVARYVVSMAVVVLLFIRIGVWLWER